MDDRPLTPMQVAQITYGALWAARGISGQRIPPWDLLRDDQKRWFAQAITREEAPDGQISNLAPISARDELIIATIRGSLAGK